MVRLRVRELAEKRGIPNPLVLSKMSKVSYATCYAIWNENGGRRRAMIGLEVIDRFCKTLKVKPGQLFVYDGDEDS